MATTSPNHNGEAGVGLMQLPHDFLLLPSVGRKKNNTNYFNPYEPETLACTGKPRGNQLRRTPLYTFRVQRLDTLPATSSKRDWRAAYEQFAGHANDGDCGPASAFCLPEQHAHTPI
ncbi:hypothetical protein ZHAS_00016846 [Anopheles sinensis]|uniref:Uncharacterized protein n=1 Tax=Anopheles sinensis TaxID=74873 RepID=A0A084WE92_ANOSI|nr:hypothetical protein ZHAS_00016846 [Anopheles sinensis]